MLPPAVRAIFFDAVGTLICPEPAAPVEYAAVGRRFGSLLTTDDIAVRFRTAFQREEARDRQNALRTNEQREVLRWRRIVAEVLDDVTDAEACFVELFEHFSRPHAWKCIAGVATTLATLSARGLIVGVASNYDRRLRSVVAGLPALGPVSQLIISSEVGWKKPAPAFFAALIRCVDLPPDQILVVGDDLDNDYEGARAAGLQAVLFEPRGDATSATLARITQLEELLQ